MTANDAAEQEESDGGSLYLAFVMNVFTSSVC